jgi:hypothetical protein
MFLRFLVVFLVNFRCFEWIWDGEGSEIFWEVCRISMGIFWEFGGALDAGFGGLRGQWISCYLKGKLKFLWAFSNLPRKLCNFTYIILNFLAFQRFSEGKFFKPPNFSSFSKMETHPSFWGLAPENPLKTPSPIPSWELYNRKFRYKIDKFTGIFSIFRFKDSKKWEKCRQHEKMNVKKRIENIFLCSLTIKSAKISIERTGFFSISKTDTLKAWKTWICWSGHITEVLIFKPFSFVYVTRSF